MSGRLHLFKIILTACLHLFSAIRYDEAFDHESQPDTYVKRCTFPPGMTNKDLKIVDERFLSFALDSSYINKHVGAHIINSSIFINLCKHLGPSFLRFGGTTSNTIRFESNVENIQSYGGRNIDLSANNKNFRNKKGNNEIDKHDFAKDFSLVNNEAFHHGRNSKIPISRNDIEFMGTSYGRNKLDQSFKSTDDDLNGWNRVNYINNNFSGTTNKDGGDYMDPFKTIEHIGLRVKREGSYKAYRMSSNQPRPRNLYRETILSGRLWDEIYQFSQKVGWDLIVTLNPLSLFAPPVVTHNKKAISEYPHWNISNIREFLNYSSNRGYKLSFQLGNEPNSYPTRFGVSYMTPQKLASYFEILRRQLLTREFPFYADAIISGPDVTKLVKYHKNLVLDPIATKTFNRLYDTVISRNDSSLVDSVPIKSPAWKFLESFLSSLADNDPVPRVFGPWNYLEKSKFVAKSKGLTWGSVMLDTPNGGSNSLSQTLAAVQKVSWHHYYLDGRTSIPSDFVDPNVLNLFVNDAKAMNSILELANRDRTSRYKYKAWLGEGGSTYGGGTMGVSDRFIAGFMFLDKLGVCATHGIEVFMRQSLVNGRYALIGQDSVPNPDYWIAILFKRLVGPKVLPLLSTHSKTVNNKENYDSLSDSQILKMIKSASRPSSAGKQPHKMGNKKFDKLLEKIRLTNRYGEERAEYEFVRVYAHCINPNNTVYNKHLGGIVIYAMNLMPKPVIVRLDSREHALGGILHSYLLTSPELHHKSNHNKWNLNRSSSPLIPKLLTREVALNGKILKMNGSKLPPLKPKITKRLSGKDHIHDELDIQLSPFSYGFFIYPKAKFEICV
ncbi:unnamed protein product [Gordionus sp. m RMFG-2023]